jgi:hypothetical protein
MELKFKKVSDIHVNALSKMTKLEQEKNKFIVFLDAIDEARKLDICNDDLVRLEQKIFEKLDEIDEQIFALNNVFDY